MLQSVLLSFFNTVLVASVGLMLLVVVEVVVVVEIVIVVVLHILDINADHRYNGFQIFWPQFLLICADIKCVK